MSFYEDRAMHILVEICVESAQSAVEAERGGADRVELCFDRSVGGITPSPGETFEVCRSLTIPVQILIRPRAGDFVHNADEIETMRQQITEAKSLGASGIVLGLLRQDGTINVEATRELVRLSRPLSVTFHKTSGQASTARKGIDCLAKLVAHANGRMAIMAGGSLTLDDIPAMIGAGLPEVHAGSCVADGSNTVAEKVRALIDAVET
jgi:copper homeostasis protein